MADKTKENPAGPNVFPVKAERYQAEHVLLATGPEDSSVAALQRALNEGARQSWRLVGVSQDPTRQGGVLLIWDMSGFISG